MLLDPREISVHDRRSAASLRLQGHKVCLIPLSLSIGVGLTNLN